MAAKVNHDWKKNNLLMESGGRKFAIDLRTQIVSEEMALSSEFKSDGEHRTDEGRAHMDPNDEGVLELEECSGDETSSLNGLFHWQMEDYELFHSYMLGIEEPKDEEEVFPPEFVENKEGNAEINECPAHCFEGKAIRYKEPLVEATNLGDAENPRNILVGGDWNSELKVAAFKIFMEYKDVFAWTCKDLKGVPPEMCVHHIPLAEATVQNEQESWSTPR